MSNVTKTYLLPKKILYKSGNIENEKALFDNEREQIFVSEKNYCICTSAVLYCFHAKVKCVCIVDKTGVLHKTVHTWRSRQGKKAAT